MLMRIDEDVVKHSWLIVFSYQKLTHLINNKKNTDGGWLEGWGTEALDNVASVGKPVGLIICRTLFLIGFEVRQFQLCTDEKSHLPSEQHWCLYILPTTSSDSLSAACQKRWVRTLAQTEWAHMWDVAPLVRVGQPQNTSAVQWQTSRWQASPDYAAWACMWRGAGNSRRSFVNTFWPLSPPSSCSQHAYTIRFTSTEL